VDSPDSLPGGMVSEFVTPPYGTALHGFAILFRYSQDETTLIIHGIGHVNLGPDLSEKG
jgi:hypothetical protein